MVPVNLLALLALSLAVLTASAPSFAIPGDQAGVALDERKVLPSPRARQYLEKHKLYVSVTTSPQRIQHLLSVIQRLDLRMVEKVYVNLPRNFGRDGSKYLIPRGLKDFPKVVINQVPEDLGPITKILPTLEKVQKRDPDSWIISIDDDQMYAPRLINDLVNARAENPHMTIGSLGHEAEYWELNHRDFPGSTENFEGWTPRMRDTEGYAVDMLEGFGGIIYRAGDLDVERLKELSSLSKTTFVSDDLVLSYHLGEQGIPKRRLNRAHPTRMRVISLEHGEGADALQYGAGFLDKRIFRRVDRMKYARALREIHEHARPYLGGVPCLKRAVDALE